MRILFLHHFPLAPSAVGRLVWQWAMALEAAGHETSTLIVDERSQAGEPLTVERIICREGDPCADLPFELPRFATQPDVPSRLVFRSLSDPQLAQYRDELRRRLDGQVADFDPHVIHAQHIWLFGQLALETGVPYIVNGWGPELAEYESDPRYRSLADQAAENAGRILVPDETMLHRIRRVFASAADRALAMPAALDLSQSAVTPEAQAAAEAELVKLYGEVLEERFGKPA